MCGTFIMHYLFHSCVHLIIHSIPFLIVSGLHCACCKYVCFIVSGFWIPNAWIREGLGYFILCTFHGFYGQFNVIMTNIFFKYNFPVGYDSSNLFLFYM